MPEDCKNVLTPQEAITCIIEFIKQVEEKRSNGRLCSAFIVVFCNKFYGLSLDGGFLSLSLYQNRVYQTPPANGECFGKMFLEFRLGY